MCSPFIAEMGRHVTVTPSGGLIEGLPKSPPSTTAISLKISSSVRRFEVMESGTITSVSSLCCLSFFI